MSWDSLPLLFVGALLLWVLYAFVREKWSPDIVAAIALLAICAAGCASMSDGLPTLGSLDWSSWMLRLSRL